MIRLALTVLLASAAFDAQASPATCRLAGTVYDDSGHPLPAAVVRLIDRQTRRVVYRAADERASFAFADLPADADGQRYRLDLLGPAMTVTGSHIRTCSVAGVAPAFACRAGASARADVRAAVR